MWLRGGLITPLSCHSAFSNVSAHHTDRWLSRNIPWLCGDVPFNKWHPICSRSLESQFPQRIFHLNPVHVKVFSFFVFQQKGRGRAWFTFFFFFSFFLFGVILFHKLKTFAEESEIWEKIQLICQIFQELRKMEWDLYSLEQEKENRLMCHVFYEMKTIW